MPGEAYRLIIKSGPNPGRAFDLTKESMTIGREAGCDIVIQEAELSRVHARIARKGNAYVIEDLGSTNGTFVRGQRLTAPRAIAPGEEIGLGDNVVVIFQGEGAAATVVAASGLSQGTAKRGKEQAYYAPAPGSAPAPAKGGGRNRVVIFGCGCLAVLCVAAVVGGFVFDYMNLYCVSPFDFIFLNLGYCTLP